MWHVASNKLRKTSEKKQPNLRAVHCNALWHMKQTVQLAALEPCNKTTGEARKSSEKKNEEKSIKITTTTVVVYNKRKFTLALRLS